MIKQPDEWMRYPEPGAPRFGALKSCLVLVFCCISAQPSEAQIIRTFTEPFLKSDVAASESGIISEIHVREGDLVKRGDVLAELDHQVLLQSLRQAEAKAESTAKIRAFKAALDLASQRVESLSRLIADGHANPHEVEQSRAEYDKAFADHVLAQEERRLATLEVDRIQVQLDMRRIRSPMDGVVVELHREIGEHISNNDPKFATVVNLERLRARFYLKMDQIKSLRKSQRVAIVVGDKSTTGIIAFVSPVMDPDSGTGRVDVLIENENSEFCCGDRCQWGSRSGVVDRISIGQGGRVIPSAADMNSRLRGQAIGR
jgi:RND family efflux transporter MFP subunit